MTHEQHDDAHCDDKRLSAYPKLVVALRHWLAPTGQEIQWDKHVALLRELGEWPDEYATQNNVDLAQAQNERPAEIAALVERLSELYRESLLTGAEQDGFTVCLHSWNVHGYDHCFRIDKDIGAFLVEYLLAWPQIAPVLRALSGQAPASPEDVRAGTIERALQEFVRIDDEDVAGLMCDCASDLVLALEAARDALALPAAKQSGEHQ